DFVVSQIRQTHWIGLNDVETERQWMWVNNQALKETGVTRFCSPGTHYEPDNWKGKDPSGENCAALGDINEYAYMFSVFITDFLFILSWNKANQNQGQCEKGWKSLGLKCYYFSTVRLNWTQGRDFCVEKGGHLVIITNQTEQEFVASQIGETHWIGLNDLETEGQWMWVNNQPLKERGVTFWYRSPQGISEPDNWKEEDPAGENCVALGHEEGFTNKWFDALCRKLKQFICEK
ncbi:hypothetical protein QTP86_025335, partial [Hemibagrus guttatus]